MPPLHKYLNRWAQKMRQFLISILFLVVCFPQCQIKTNTIVIEEANTIVTEEVNWTNGILYRTIRDTITLTTEEPDINFFREHFNLLYHLPDTLTKKEYKSSKVQTWALKNKKEDQSKKNNSNVLCHHW